MVTTRLRMEFTISLLCVTTTTAVSYTHLNSQNRIPLLYNIWNKDRPAHREDLHKALPEAFLHPYLPDSICRSALQDMPALMYTCDHQGMYRRLGEPLPHQLANTTHAHLTPPKLSTNIDAYIGIMGY